MFRRRQRDEATESEAATAENAAVEEGSATAAGGTPRPSGPWDADDAPEGDRVDLGGLLLPPDPEVAWRADLDPAGTTVVAVSAVLGEAAVQLQPFAAPRTEPLWPEVLAEIEDGLAGEGGAPQTATGPFGPELRGTVATGDGPRRTVVFAGVDGPRWLLRLVYSGAGVDGEQRLRLDEIVRGVVVVRGSEPMAPRDLIPLRLPPGAEPAR